MPAVFGLDIGSSSIKAVQIERKRNSFRLVTLGEIKTPVDFYSQSLNDKRTMAAAIKKLVDHIKLTTSNVVLSLPETAVFSQVIELPFLSETELASAINFEAEQYIPVPLTEVRLEYIVISSQPKGKDKNMEVMLVAAQKNAIKQMSEIINMAGLTPVALETEIFALARTVKNSSGGDCLVLDLGHQTSKILSFYQGNIILTRTLKTAGEALTRAIVRDLNMDFFKAEQYKNTYGLEPEALEGKIRRSLLPTFNVIVTELKKTQDYFSQKILGGKINILFVSGAGALLPGLNSYLAQSLNLEVGTFDPFKNLTSEKRIEEIKNKPKFATVIGLALREEE